MLQYLDVGVPVLPYHVTTTIFIVSSVGPCMCVSCHPVCVCVCVPCHLVCVSCHPQVGGDQLIEMLASGGAIDAGMKDHIKSVLKKGPVDSAKDVAPQDDGEADNGGAGETAGDDDVDAGGGPGGKAESGGVAGTAKETFTIK